MKRDFPGGQRMSVSSPPPLCLEISQTFVETSATKSHEFFPSLAV